MGKDGGRRNQEGLGGVGEVEQVGQGAGLGVTEWGVGCIPLIEQRDAHRRKVDVDEAHHLPLSLGRGALGLYAPQLLC